MVMRQFILAASLVLGLCAPASASVLGSTSSLNNDVIGSTEGYFGTNLFSTGNLTVTFTLVGYEAGATNSFQLGPNQITGGGGQNGTLSVFATPSQSFTTTVGPVLLDFAFLTNLN